MMVYFIILLFVIANFLSITFLFQNYAFVEEIKCFVEYLSFIEKLGLDLVFPGLEKNVFFVKKTHTNGFFVVFCS